MLCVLCWAIRRSLRSYRFTSCSKAATSPFLLAWTRLRSSSATVLIANCAKCAVIFVQGALKNNRVVEAIEDTRNGKPPPLRCSLEVAASLHHDLAVHLRVDRSEVGIRSLLGKRVGELFFRTPTRGLEPPLCLSPRMRHLTP